MQSRQRELSDTSLHSTPLTNNFNNIFFSLSLYPTHSTSVGRENFVLNIPRVEIEPTSAFTPIRLYTQPL